MKKELLFALKAYVFTSVLLFIIILFNTSFSKTLQTFYTLFTTKQGLLFFHGAFIVFYLLFLLIRYFIRVYKNSGGKKMLKYMLLRFLLPTALVVFGIKYIVHKNTQEDFNYTWDHSIENTKGVPNNLYRLDGKHRGMNVYGIERNTTTNMEDLIKSNIEWISVFPYFYQKDENTSQINTPEKIGAWSNRDSLFIKNITDLQAKGLHIMLKPHLWMSEGWRSNIHFDSDEEWNLWFTYYKKTMLHYATMAEITNVELLCIGTELNSSMIKQPKQWMELVKEIRSIYKGKLTYAANWNDSYNTMELWNELDYIGIQAYYPLTKVKNPDLTTIKKGWDPYMEELESVSRQYNKPILFTEVGYRNDAYATKEPWKWGSIFTRLYVKKSDRTQQLAYEALFSRLWNKEWFAGTFAWQWNSGDFPIRSKPSENTIAKWYGVNFSLD